jgi:hypothetical protein
MHRVGIKTKTRLFADPCNNTNVRSRVPSSEIQSLISAIKH